MWITCRHILDLYCYVYNTRIDELVFNFKGNNNVLLYLISRFDNLDQNDAHLHVNQRLKKIKVLYLISFDNLDQNDANLHVN